MFLRFVLKFYQCKDRLLKTTMLTSHICKFLQALSVITALKCYDFWANPKS